SSRSRCRDRTPRSAAPCRTYAPPCAGSFPWSTRRRGCHQAERKAFVVNNQRDHYLFAVGAMIARVAAPHHRILLGRAFHVGADQVVQQHVELSPEQLSIAL